MTITLSYREESPVLDKMQFIIQFNSKQTLSLINGISIDLQKFLKYFNGATIFVFFTKLFPLSTSTSFPTRVALYLND